MTTRPVLTPNPAHPITIERNPNRVQVLAGDTVIADTTNALTLREANYPPVHYIPRADADMAQLRRSDHSTYCPYKGEAAYFDIVGPELVEGGERGRNAVWTYEHPYPAVAEIAGHLAFYPDKVEIREVGLTALDASITRGLANADEDRTKPAAEVLDRLSTKYRTD